jgi:hypothetical protein
MFRLSGKEIPDETGDVFIAASFLTPAGFDCKKNEIRSSLTHHMIIRVSRGLLLKKSCFTSLLPFTPLSHFQPALSWASPSGPRRGMPNALGGGFSAANDLIIKNNYFISGFPETSIEFMQSFNCFHGLVFFTDYFCA